MSGIVIWCRSCNKTKYIDGKSVDPIGLLSKDGKMNDIGALSLSDFDFKTLMNTTLSNNELKSLVSVHENGSIKARYGNALFPKHLPRSFSVNLGHNPDTGADNDPASFFQDKLDGMVYLINQDVQKLKTMDDSDRAIVRRCVVFILPDNVDLHIGA